MANGWGGRREGAGRKPSPRADNENAPGAAPRKKPDRRPIDFAALAELVEQSRAAARTRPRTLDWCPYQIATHPPRAMPPKSSGLAMDDNSGLVGNNAWCQTEWMGGGMLSSAVSEGMLFPGYPMLSEMAQRPEYRLASATISEEMTRKWFVFKGTGDQDKTEKIKELTDFLSDLKVRERFQQAALDDGFFGRSHIWLDCGDAKDEEQEKPIGAGRKDPMTKGKVVRGWLKRLQVIEPVWVYPTTYNANNPMSADWYDPQVWYVMGRKVHRSRMPTFIGRPVPDLLKPAYSFGGLSLSQMGKPYVDIWLRTRESVAEIVRSFSVMVLKTDLATILAPGGAADLIARVMAFNMMRDNQGTLVVNKDTEDFANIAAPVSGLDHLQAQAQEHLCSVWRIPTVKYTGIQPTGLNASSDGEIRVFHETIAAYQEALFGENLDFVIDVAQMSLWGEVDPEIVREWVPLWSLSDKEEAEVRKIETETDEKNVAMGALSPEEVRTRLANDPGSPYAGLDPEDVPDLMEEEEQGLEPLGGRPQPVAGKGDGGGEDADPFDDAGVDRALALDAEWKESDHPRAPDGKFGSGGGSGSAAKSSAAKPKPAKMMTAKKGQPIKLNDMEVVGGKKGSNPAQVMKDPETGVSYYVKKLKSPAHATNEYTAAGLYQLAGIPTLTYKGVEGDDKAVATYMNDLQKSNVSQLDVDQKKMARDNFVTHAWLANWDAVGTGGDNIGVLNGQYAPAILDVGGALEYRAQGKPKGDAFGDKVGELWAMTDPKQSPDAANLFAGMTMDQIKASAIKVLAIDPESIRETVKANGGSDALADKLIARQKDIADQLGLNAEFEALHPRGAGGKFVKGAGAITAGEIVAQKAAEPGKPKKTAFGGLWKAPTEGESEFSNFMTNVKHVLGKPANAGISYRQMLAHMVKKAAEYGADDEAKGQLKAKLIEAWQKAGEKAMAAGDVKEAHKIQSKLIELGLPHAPAGTKAPLAVPPETKKLMENLPKPEKTFAEKAAEHISGPAKPNLPKPTPEQAKKAQKATSLPLNKASPEANNLVKVFNDKWAGKTGLTDEQVAEKIHNFESMQASAKVLDAAHHAKQADEQKKVAAAAKEKAGAEAKQAAAANKEVMKDLGVGEQEAEGFIALAQMLGKSNKDLAAAFKANEAKAQGLGYPISGFGAALISNYSDGGYSAINKALRSGSWTVAQHVYVKLMNKALQAMPTYAGTVKRGTHLTAAVQGLYKVGNVVEERAFTSTSISNPFGGDTEFVITAIGKRGAHIKKLSNYPGEDEVVFSARTFFKVTKIDGTAGGPMKIHMEELED